MKLLILMLIATIAVAEDRPTLRCTWDPPIMGVPVTAYIVELWSLSDSMLVWTGATIHTAIAIPDSVVEPGVEYYNRVSGIDNQGRQGEWSLPIDYFWDTGPPGPPLNFRWVEE